MLRFDGMRILVTGAGRGIGRDIAKTLYKYGAEVLALSRTPESLTSLVKECPAIKPVQCDLADWENTRKTVKNLGDIHHLVNNAAIATMKPFQEFTPEDFDRIININMKAVLNVSQVVVGGMISRGTGGSIVNVSSGSSIRALHGRALYGASKAGLDHMTRVMALEFGSHQIRVNSVNPTLTLTDMGRKHWFSPDRADALNKLTSRIMLNRVAEMEEVTWPVLFLLSDLSSMITGHSLPIDGGWSVS